MKIVELTWYPYAIPFRAPFLTAHGTLSSRRGAIVAVRTDTGITGYGEIAPLPEFSNMSLANALRPLPELARELAGRAVEDLLCWLDVQSQDQHLSASLLYGLETALLDAMGKACGESVAALLTRAYPEERPGETPRTRVAVNAVISGTTTELVVEKARAACAAGFTCLKLKLTEASRAMSERVAAVRAAIGPELRLRLDANEAWDMAQARSMLTSCAPYAIEYVEQPLPAHDLAGMARLRRVSPIPLAIDEALSSVASARRVLKAEAADILILKPQLAGGLRACRQIIQEAHNQDTGCVITSSLEAGIGVTAALHLAAASPEITLACGLATLALLVDDLLLTEPTRHGGMIALPIEPGLGIQLDSAALQRYGSQELYRSQKSC